jgi:chaperonin GroES
MRLRPLHDWVLLRRGEPAGRSAGGIIIPESAKEKQSEGIVEAVGPGRVRKGKRGERFVPTVLRPGQRVFFTDYAARDINLDGKMITVIREEDVLGTLEGGAPAPHRIESSEGRAVSAGKKEKAIKSGTVAKTRKTVRKGERNGKTGRPVAAGKLKKKVSGVASSKKETKPAKKKLKPTKVSTASKTSRKRAAKKPAKKSADRSAASKVKRHRTKVTGKTAKKVTRRTKNKRK